MTQAKTISITRALVELKTLEDRIQAAIRSGQFIGPARGRETQKTMADAKKSSLNDAEAVIKGSFDKVESLIEYRQKLKGAVIQSNATTFAKLGDVEYTVAQLIEMKGTVGFYETFVNTLRSQRTQVVNMVDKANAELESQINALLLSVYAKDKTKVAESDVEAIAKPQRDAKEQSVFDPCEIDKKIEKIQEKITSLKSELDFVLSESNARTTITV